MIDGGDEAPAPFALVAASDAHFAWLLGEAGAPAGLREPRGGVETPAVLAWLRALAARLRATDAEAAWLMTSDGEVVGLCSYKAPPNEAGAVEIGYGVALSRRRRGHATTAVAHLVAQAMGDPRLTAVLAETSPLNNSSHRVLERNGFVPIGRRRDAEEGELIVWRLELRSDGPPAFSPSP